MPPKKPKGKKKPAVAQPSALAIAEPEGTMVYYKNCGNQAFASSEFILAIGYYSQALQLSTDAPPDELAKVYSNRSAAYVGISDLTDEKLSELSSSSPVLSPTLNHNPDPTDEGENGLVDSCASLLGVGLAERKRQALGLALADAQTCIDVCPVWPKGYYRKGCVLVELERWEEAQAVLEEGLQRAPEGSAGEIVKTLREVKEKVVKLEIERDARESPDRDKFDLLMTWLRDGGSEFPYLYMKRYSENNRGVHCMCDVAPEEVILKVPLKFLITVEMGKDTEVGKIMGRSQVDLTAVKHCYLSVFVLLDRRNPESFFQPYYRILPTVYDNMPLMWDEDDLVYLDGSYMLKQIEDRRANIKADYISICEVAPVFAEIPLDDFVWARLMVASRNFGITVDNVKTDALVPFADMLNHFRPRQTKWTYEESESAFTITSLQDLEAGQQVYDSYGKKCNSRFLLNYGFAVEHNTDPDGRCHNEVRFYFDLDKTDPGLGFKLSLLGGDSPGRGLRLSMNHDDKSTIEAMAYARFICARGNEIMVLPRMDESYDLGETPILPISVDTEIRALELLCRLSSEQLARYPTTLQEDLDRLATDSTLIPYSNKRNAVILVKGEKEVCRFWVDLFHECASLCAMEWKDFKKAVAKINKTNAKGRYIDKVLTPLMRKRASEQST